VAYFLLTGKPVFEAKSVMEILQMHMKAEPSLPSKHAPSSLPAELESLVLSALAKSPGQRPASTREMLQLLDDWSIQYPWSQSAARGTESSNFSRTVVERDLAIDETTFITDTDVR
jgi:serine/threonine protein kinase